MMHRPTTVTVRTEAPAQHVCRVCEVGWRDYSWSPSPCWSCGALTKVGGAGILEPTQTLTPSWPWHGVTWSLAS